MYAFPMASIERTYDKMLVKIAANIKRVRKAKGISQPSMAKFGFDVRNYQRLESGEHSPSLFTLHKLAYCFEVDINEFFK
jgi:transcriptional regulator with XRE-family HTH domain